MKKNRNFFQSLRHALDGIVCLYKEERNMWKHTLVAILVVVAGFLLKLSHIEWLLVTLCIVGVFACEIINTLFERLCDRMTTEYDDRIRKIKDISAGFVLLVCLGSVAVGLIIFLPKFIALF